MKLLLSPVTAVTCDAAGTVIAAAALHIEDDLLTYVGPASLAPTFEPDEAWGGPHLVAIPGLVNTHTHAGMTLLRGYADDMALEPWLAQKIWPLEARLTPDAIYWGTLLAIAEMVRGGTTCFADMYFAADHGVRAMLESGIRACPSAVLLGFLPGADAKIADGLAWLRHTRTLAPERITPVLGPHSLYTCTRPQWEKVVQGAHDADALITTHVAETPSEVAQVVREWGLEPFAALHSVGALERPLLAAHCVHTSPAERELMQAHRVRVAHNPQSNLKLASGIAPVADYLERGLAVGLATDGPASNNNLDLWEEMRLAATLHKAATSDPNAVSAHQALLLATREGARCLGLDNRIGSLEAGKQADLALVNFDQPHLLPCHNVVSNLVYSAGSADVCATLVAGRWLYRKGIYPTLDVAQIAHQVQRLAADLIRPR